LLKSVAPELPLSGGRESYTVRNLVAPKQDSRSFAAKEKRIRCYAKSKN